MYQISGNLSTTVIYLKLGSLEQLIFSDGRNSKHETQKNRAEKNRQIMYHDSLVKDVKIKQKSIIIHEDESAP